VTDDELFAAYDAGFKSAPEQRVLGGLGGLRAVADAADRAAVRRVLDELDRVRVSRDFELYPGYTIREFVRLMREGLE
jgi:hypothetical protein